MEKIIDYMNTERSNKPVSGDFLLNALEEDKATINPSNKLNTNGLCAPSARFDVI